MTIGKMKCVNALRAFVYPNVNRLNWKVWVMVFFLGGSLGLSSCTAFEESYYEQADSDGGGRKCKVVDSVIICE